MASSWETSQATSWICPALTCPSSTFATPIQWALPHAAAESPDSVTGVATITGGLLWANGFTHIVGGRAHNGRMRYSPLGNSGLMVSVVGVGCNAFGARIDADQTKAVVDAAIEAG